MVITNDDIENELIGYFNPFAFNGIKYGKSEGGFDVQKADDNNLKFVLFDKKWEDEDKTEIWSETINISEYKSMLELKVKCAPIIEMSILTFCQS